MASIVAEAERHPGACPHVATPARPHLLYGVSPAEAMKMAETWAAQTTDSRGHALRKDGLCLLGGVISMPPGTDEKLWNRYRDASLKWLKKHYGDRLKGVIEHTDEPHPHIHFYAVPRVGERFDVLHDGLRAARLANPDRGKRDLPKAEKQAAKKEALLAYADGMRKYQGIFYEAVSRRFGLTRLGPGRRRLTRAEWKAEQEVAQALAKSYADLAKGKKQVASATVQLREEAATVAADKKELAELESKHQIAAWYKDKVRGLSPSQMAAARAAFEAEVARQQRTVPGASKDKDYSR